MKEENQIIIRALNMYGRVPEQWELLKEIERLNNIIKKARKYIEEMLDNFYNDDFIKQRRKIKNISEILKGDDK